MKKSTYLISIIFILSLIMLIFPISSKAQNEAQIYIDYPVQNEVCKDTLTVHGWFMSAIEDKSLKIFIDSEENDITEAIERYDRPDVTGSVTGYGTAEQNPLAGFKGTVDISQYKDGTHTLIIQAIHNGTGEVIGEVEQKFIVQKYNTQLYIDYPMQNEKEKNEVYVHGWLMSEAENKELKVYVDNEQNDVTASIERYNRPDVTGSITGYGTAEQNPLAGYRGTIDLSTYSDGQHKIYIQIINTDTDEVIAEDSRTIYLQKYNTQIYIDFPEQNKQVSGIVYIHGWLMSEAENKELKVYIDNEQNDVTESITRYNRPDVTGSITGYGTAEQNPLAGFDGRVNINSYKDGEHKVIFQVINTETNEVMAEDSRTIYLQKYNTQLYIDYPVANEQEKDTVYVHGWLMSEATNKEVKVYIDSEENDVTSNIERYARPDVTGSITGYGTPEQNPLAGYRGTIDLSNYRDGNHTVIIQVVNTDTDEVIAQDSRTIYVKKYNTQVYVDYPSTNQTVKTSVNIHGWLMSEAENKEIKVYIDSTQNDVTSSIERYARPDVTGSITGYGTAEQNPLAGFDGTVDVSNFRDGEHTVILQVINTDFNEVIEEVRQTFYIKKYNTQIYVDYPVQGQNYRNSLSIHGWYMSEQPNKEIRFYLNNQNITSQINLYNRPDVTGSITGYGTPEQNPLAGFDGTINVSGYASGDYTLKIEVYSTTLGEIIDTLSYPVTINEFTYEEGTYGISGLRVQRAAEGDDLRYYRIGDGPNVLFAVFSVHGFEDGWHKDGQELSYIADQFKNHLLQNQMNYQDVLNNWTIYIFPCANTDGQYYGWDNNGAGRTTLYSAAPGHQGIDMNRCWSVGYIRRTSTREYNGTEPFQAYEARYLRDFLLSKKSSSGRTILIDLHGWLNESIGDNGLGSYYRSEYGMSTHISSYGGGYLINWARSSLSNTRSALIELPPVSNHNQVVSRDYAGKYIRATISMLRNS